MVIWLRGGMPISERKRLAVAAYVAGGTAVAAILERYQLSQQTLYRALSAADIRRRRRLSAKPPAPKKTERKKRKAPAGERVGGRYYRLLKGEAKAECRCCHEMFKPYVYDYQECRHLCLYCYTGQWRPKEGEEE